MEKKLLAYYQSLVQPVEEWGPFFDPCEMLDGTDVDAQINKKRAHKIIMDESFNVGKRSLFKLKKKKAGRPAKKPEGEGG